MIIYEGFFVIDSLESSLSKDIEYKHITTEFKPTITHEHLYGKETNFMIVGYGNNQVNEGYLVKMTSCEDEELQSLYEKIPVPHITLSVSETGKPVDTAKLTFKNTERFVVRCKFGGYIGKPIFENNT